MFFISFIFYYCQQVLFTLYVSSLLSPLNDASVDTADFFKGYFQFSPEIEFTSPLYVHFTLATDIAVESLCFAQLLRC